jgi:hypothetical protein
MNVFEARPTKGAVLLVGLCKYGSGEQSPRRTWNIGPEKTMSRWVVVFAALSTISSHRAA